MSRIDKAALLVAGLLVGLFTAGARADPSSPPVYNAANGHWYQDFRTGGLTWQQARDAAAALSYAGLPGHLVTITSSEENQFILSQLPNTTGSGNEYWLGLYQDRSAPDYREPDGGWRWITGEPYSWNDWRGEPNNANGNEDVAVMRSTVGWNDLSYTNLQYGYIVEYEFPVAAVSLSQLLLIPTSVVGGQPAIGQVMLSQFAGSGGVVVPLSSSNPAAAVVPATVTVPAGASGITFPITTFAVAADTPVVLTAGGPGSPVSATLLVQPSSSPPVNLLVNGSFEEPPIPSGQAYRTLRPGELPGWRIVRGTVDVHQSWQQAPGEGRQSLGLVGSSAGAVEQSFSTEPGREYLFSGWVSHDYGNGVPEGRANVYLNGSFFIHLAHNLPAAEADMHWLPFSFRFRASTAVTTLTISDVTGITDLQGTVLDGLTVTPADVTNLPPPLNAPIDLTAQVISTQQLNLTWTDDSNNETGFAIYRRTGADFWVPIALVDPNITRFADAGVSPGITYTYRVQAINDAGGSAWSNEAPVTVPSVSPPGSTGDLLVTSHDTQSVLRYSGPTGAFVGAFIPSGDGGAGPSHGLLFGPDGNLYLGDIAAHAVRRYNGVTGAFIDLFVAPGSGGLNHPDGMVFGPDGNLYISSYFTDSVLRYDGRSGAFLGPFALRGSGGLQGPGALAFGPDGNFYVTSEKTHSVLRYDGRTGAFIDAFVASGSGGLDHPDGLLFGPDGQLYVSTYTRNEVLRYDGRTGAFLGIFVPAGSGGLDGPTKIRMGPDQNLYVVSQNNNQVLRYNGSTGAFIDTFVAPGSGGLNGPTDLAFVLGPPVGLPTPTGVGAIASLGWDARDFGTVPLGTSNGPQTLTITNAGTGPLVLGRITVGGANPEEFAISRGADTIAPGETGSISIVFTPAALGNRSARLTITSNATNSVGEIRLTGAASQPVIASINISPSSLGFGDQLVGTTNGAQAVLLQNTGPTAVEIRHVSIQGANPGDFAITADGATGVQLLPSRIVIVNVRFLPTTAGPRSASLTITDTAAGSPHLVPLSGTGLAAAVQLSSSSLTFGEQPVNSASGAQTVTITNSGTAPLTIPAVTLAGDNPAEFTIGTAASGVTLAPGESRTLEVRFAPTRPGSRRALLVISDTAPGSPHLVALSGTGTAPSVTFGISRLERPTKVSFGDQPVGTTGAAQTLTVTNSGAAPLTISSVRITGANAADFALSADSGGPILAPGKSRQFTLRFKPASKGARGASLTMSDNAAGSPHSVALQGVGLLVPPKAPSGLTLKAASYKEIQLTWTASSADATAYSIWRKTGNGEFQRYGGVAGNLTRFVDQHVTPKTSYTYRVRANGPGGVSGWSNEATGAPPAAPPVAPSGLTVRPLSASQLELRWTDNSSDETGFALWRKSGTGAWARIGGVPSGTSRYVDRKLVPNTSYSYQVRSNGPGGVSAWSAPASGTTLSGPI